MRLVKSLVTIFLFSLVAFLTVDIASAKVIWDGAEITAGQTGKLSFNKDTKIYKKNADGSFTSMIAPKGSYYRVYGTISSSTGKVYNMSGGYRVNATNLVTYKDVPVGVQDQLNIKVVQKPYFVQSNDGDEAEINYAEISGLTNEKMQRQMNNYLISLAEMEKLAYEEAVEARDATADDYEDYPAPPIFSFFGTELDYNNKGYISFGINSTTYYGGAHGYYYESAVHYNLITSKHINLSEFVKTPNQRQKLNTFVLQQMKKANVNIDATLYWTEDFTGIPMTQPFFIKDDGIELIFNPYDMGSYAAGLRYIFVPFNVFQ